ncbi:cytidylate kinase-like family protein [Prevotella sp. A2931]|uniref:Cytidylate kinase-like family protein n=1 Tax=Prevotella illustrans TaxID=2800387 RepID=A0ABS3M4B3_9BACT|nr:MULTISPECIES: cytidylate kinase-like family protein [Prevotella]MBO1363015.1 cytidylate kinase-like family protein [Prevotella illustrans]PTL25491.1 cytidylate kinase [Prevotella sp. oral taxon 820]
MNNHTRIINIGRQIGSGGLLIAKELARNLGFVFYDREILNLAAKESGFCERFFEQNDERKGFLRSLFHVHVPLLGESNFYRNDFSQESLYQFQSDAIRKAAEQSDCVFVGRTADYILRDYRNVVNIFITADPEERLRRVAERLRLNEEAARKLIEDKEESRAAYYNYYTGKKWGHASSYDLCVNSGPLGLKGTAELIEDFVRRRFQMTPDR